MHVLVLCVCVLHKYRCNIEKTVETSRPDGDIKTACIGAPIHAYVLGCEREREGGRERERDRYGERGRQQVRLHVGSLRFCVTFCVHIYVYIYICIHMMVIINMQVCVMK